MSKQKQAGFTIVELLVTIVVIGILAAIVSVVYGGIQQRAKISLMQSDLRQASSQLELSRIEQGQYPATVDSLSKSGSTKYQYSVTETGYCLTATAQGVDDAYHISSDVKTTVVGVCSGHYANTIATGGIVQDVDIDGMTYRVHTFTSSGEFKLNQAIPVEYLIVGGGGGGGGGRINGYGGSGGGGGGVLLGGANLSAGSYGVTVGSGGGVEERGSDSALQGIALAPGGGAGAGPNSPVPGSGASGGGGIPGVNPGAGTTGLGFAGGVSSTQAGGGGGGAGGAGGDGGPAARDAGDGGSGLLVQITGAAVYFGGGGGASNGNGGSGGIVSTGGIGGGGGGASGARNAGDGVANTGGGGGASRQGTPGSGGSGIVIIRYALP